MNKCSSCRYWSDQLAQVKHGVLYANYRGEYRTGNQGCGGWQSGHLGAIDEPGSDPLRYDVERCEL